MASCIEVKQNGRHINGQNLYNVKKIKWDKKNNSIIYTVCKMLAITIAKKKITARVWQTTENTFMHSLGLHLTK